MLFIYIHGFNSSSQSFKARAFQEFLLENYPDDEFICPELSDLPLTAIRSLKTLIEVQPCLSQIALIGSSLGGFYATWLAERYGIKAVLVNPAVNPQILLLDYLGKNINYYTGEQYEFSHEHIEQLESINIRKITRPDNLMVLLQTADEVLDYRLAENKYRESHLFIENGGDHSFQKFDEHCESIYQFLCFDY